MPAGRTEVEGDVAVQPVPEQKVARIIRDPRICGGQPTVAGTRVPVSSVVIQWQYYQNVERVQQAFPRLDVPSIKAALEFYEEHRSEVDRLIEENERAAYAAD